MPDSDRPSPPLFRLLKPDAPLRVRSIGLKPRIISDLYHELLQASWPQLAGLFALSFLAFNLIFAALYSLDPNALGSIRELDNIPRFWRAFFFSVHTVATIGYGDVYPLSIYANWLVVAEITLGILFFALTTGIAFARFSRPTARILFSNVAVITPVDGIPTLMFRAANQRHNLIFGAAASVTVLLDEQVAGATMRRFRDLALIRDMNPVFALTWTIMHPITEDSPLFVLLGDGEPDQDIEIVAILSGVDERTGQTIFARWAYGLADIRPNARFADILGQTPDGTRTIDYRRFHDVEEGE
jgi:inward rectifier potassium channel